MDLFQHFVRALRSQRDFWRSHFQRKTNLDFNLDVQTLRSLEFIAEREQRSAQEIAAELLQNGMRDHLAQDLNWRRWKSLTPREQEITALICLDYTTRQIASRLHISPETVKTHVEHLLSKFDTSDREELRRVLSHWDFSAWEQESSYC